MRTFVSQRCIRTELISVFAIKRRLLPQQPTIINTCHKAIQSLSKWLSTLSLSFIDFLYIGLFTWSLLILYSVWEGFQYFMLLRTSEEYIGTPSNSIWNCFFSFLIYFTNSVILSFNFFFLFQPLFLCLFLSSPPPIPLVEISRNKRKAPSWMERFIIFSSHLANCPVSVHIWSVDNWVVPYLRDLLTLSQRTFDILLWSSLL